jgi:hypothetical protein
MKIRYAQFMLLLMPLQTLLAQVYIGASDNKIFLLNPDFSTSYLSTMPVSSGALLDLAVSPSGQLYASVGDKLILVNPVSGETTPVADGGFSVGLVCGNDNTIYFIQTEDDNINVTHFLRKYSLADHTFQTLTQVPGYTPGDLTLYKGNLIFQIIGFGSTGQFNLMAYNLTTNTLSTVLCNNNPQHIFYGLINTFNQCDENTIIGSSGLIGDEVKFFEIDLDDKTITQVGTTDININGLAATTEHFASACEPYNFPTIDCSLGINENIWKNPITLFPNPTTDILQVQTLGTVDQIEVYDPNGRLVAKNQNAATINLGLLQTGIYMTKVTASNASYTSKIVKQ